MDEAQMAFGLPAEQLQKQQQAIDQDAQRMTILETE